MRRVFGTNELNTWIPRVDPETGVAHLTAPLTIGIVGSPHGVLGYAMLCTPATTIVHDEISYVMISTGAERTEQATCLLCLAKES